MQLELSSSHISSTPQDLIEQRKQRVELLAHISNAYYAAPSDSEIPEKVLKEIEELFAVENRDSSLWKTIIFTLNAFRKALKPRMDGKPLVVHSLELALKAQSFGINDELTLMIALLHDTLEDTPTAPGQINSLSRQTAKPELTALIDLFTEERTDGLTRDQQLVSFIAKLSSSKSDPQMAKTVLCVELIDRIDDLSDIEYLIKDLEREDTGKSVEARQKLAEKLAKCRYTVDALTEGVKEEAVLSLKARFDSLYSHIFETYQVSADILNERMAILSILTRALQST